ncbi:PSDC domain protein [Rhizoctonia solani AG-3 Rhs1AP]|uniref:PSDC domain protein n=1 Tax=Rhizoctonia solani AG-3 Rhs1AP TaxID=1086054 RepID=A0A0A1UI31_9AGAM|nr:PSDC domain protein [Rhizoctonia solani AG-3 Rhs1AP]
MHRNQDATYTPPTLPAHVSIKLGPISGAPTDDDMIKVQDAVQTYQELKRIPSMFDEHVNMELSQHLFDLQMARYMRLAGESQPSHKSPAGIAKQTSNTTEDASIGTNNAGTGSSAVEAHPTPGTDIRELLERSNQLAERFNMLLERSNDFVERSSQPKDLPNPLAERVDQMLGRLTQLEAHAHRHAEPNQPIEHFRQLFERFNQLVEQSARSANQLAEHLTRSSDHSNYLTEQLNQSIAHSNLLANQTHESKERFGGTLRNINNVLVGIQHAIVRGFGGNTISALDCLVNNRGETPGTSKTTEHATFKQVSELHSKYPNDYIPVIISGASRGFYSPDRWLGRLLCFYGISKGICENETSTNVKSGKQKEARDMLNRYLSSCLG